MTFGPRVGIGPRFVIDLERESSAEGVDSSETSLRFDPLKLPFKIPDVGPFSTLHAVNQPQAESLQLAVGPLHPGDLGPWSVIEHQVHQCGVGRGAKFLLLWSLSLDWASDLAG